MRGCLDLTSRDSRLTSGSEPSCATPLRARRVKNIVVFLTTAGGRRPRTQGLGQRLAEDHPPPADLDKHLLTAPQLAVGLRLSVRLEVLVHP